jgi:hypothetical protein
MLLAQFIAHVLTMVKRFDSVVMHAKDSVRGLLGTVRSSGEADLG